jgi:hypothetical protein
VRVGRVLGSCTGAVNESLIVWRGYQQKLPGAGPRVQRLSARGPYRIRRGYGAIRIDEFEWSRAMGAYLLSFSADSLGAQRTNN